MAAGCNTSPRVPRFERRFFDTGEPVTAIGDGSPGGKARGLIRIRDLLAARPRASGPIAIDVPAMAVIQTGVFERFMERNRLWNLVRGGAPDQSIALAFQSADFPVEYVGDLRAIVEQVHLPLAVRSSSLLEDALQHPFAGVYTTKMIPNDQPDADSRFRRLTEAIKLVYASTFFAAARRYVEAAGRGADEERMAVVVQEVVGRRHGVRYYPDVSGVARSYSFYRSGTARPEDGFVALALGLGKTIVDGGLSWNYSPVYPRAVPPFASPSELLDATQREFWAVSMSGRLRYDPASEVEYLDRCPLADAEQDGTLRLTASSYDPASDRLHPGLRGTGPRALTFAPLLAGDALPVNATIRALLGESEQALGAPVEIEFALTFGSTRGSQTPALDAAPVGSALDEHQARCGFLQVRPMAISTQPVVVADADFESPLCIVASDAVLGNGDSREMTDVVFVRPEQFDPADARLIAADIAAINADLVAGGRRYVLIGFGRWGTSDPWLGTPIDWASIAGAHAIVETSRPERPVDPSQGSHFFHNLSSFGVLYFMVRPGVDPPIAWSWLDSLPVEGETARVRHARTPAPLHVKVDGRAGRGVILQGGGIA